MRVLRGRGGWRETEGVKIKNPPPHNDIISSKKFCE